MRPNQRLQDFEGPLPSHSEANGVVLPVPGDSDRPSLPDAQLTLPALGHSPWLLPSTLLPDTVSVTLPYYATFVSSPITDHVSLEALRKIQGDDLHT